MSQLTATRFTGQVLDKVLELVSDGLWDWHTDTGYVYRSPGWYKMMGYDIDALSHTMTTWETAIHPDDLDRVMTCFDNYTSGLADTYQIEYRCHRFDGSYIWINDEALIVAHNADGTVARMIGAQRDIHSQKTLLLHTELEQSSLQDIIDKRTQELLYLNQQLETKVSKAQHSATTDALTTLTNRFYFETKLRSECARAERFNEALSLIAVDIDYFKDINDQFGHAIGDKVLINVATIIRDNVRGIDTPSRWGGDELMILLVNTSLEKARQVAEKIRVLLCTEQTQQLTVTASFGVAQLQPSEQPHNLTLRADAALYQAKRSGRNKVCIEQAGQTALLDKVATFP